jgi:hypothetical protein
LPTVEDVVNVFPQLQVTWISVYFGWMPDFIVSSFSVCAPGSADP